MEGLSIPGVVPCREKGYCGAPEDGALKYYAVLLKWLAMRGTFTAFYVDLKEPHMVCTSSIWGLTKDLGNTVLLISTWILVSRDL